VKDAPKKEMKEKQTDRHEKRMLTATLGRQEHEVGVALKKRRKLDVATASKPRTNKPSQEMNTRAKSLQQVGLFPRPRPEGGSGSGDVSAGELEDALDEE